MGLDPVDYIQRERKAGRRQVDIFAHVGLGEKKRGDSVSNVVSIMYAVRYESGLTYSSHSQQYRHNYSAPLKSAGF